MNSPSLKKISVIVRRSLLALNLLNRWPSRIGGNGGSGSMAKVDNKGSTSIDQLEARHVKRLFLSGSLILAKKCLDNLYL